MKTYTAIEICKLLGGELKGDPTKEVSGIKPVDTAREGDLSFFAPTSKKKRAELYKLAQTSGASVILVDAFESELPMTQISVKNPLQSVIYLASFLYPSRTPTPGIHPTAVIDSTASVADDASVGPFCVVGANCSVGSKSVLHPMVVLYEGASVGDHCIIHSGAVLRENVILGNDCLIQNGAVIGSDGFGYIPDPQLGHRRIPHVGIVALEDRVDLGANTTIDRATLGETRIKTATKIDNLVQVAHNCQVGRNSLLCAQVGISGSSTVGDQVVLAGQVGVADHTKIGDKVRVAAQSGVGADIESGRDMMGFPAFPAKEFWRQIAAIKRLPELIRRLNRQEQEIADLHKTFQVLLTKVQNEEKN